MGEIAVFVVVGLAGVAGMCALVPVVLRLAAWIVVWIDGGSERD